MSWLEGAGRNFLGTKAGTMNHSGARRILLHSTEGGSIAGAIAAFKEKTSWPTMTVDLKRRIIEEHYPLEAAARALRNLSDDPGPTNGEGTILVQIEIVGFAHDPTTMGSIEDWKWFGREVIGKLCKQLGVPISSNVRWVPYPASFGAGQGQRLNDVEFRNFSGIFGHEHADENVHGDPGAIPIQVILDAARGTSTQPGDDDMPFYHTIRCVGRPTLLVSNTGLRAEYNDPDQLAAAAKQLDDAGYTHGKQLVIETRDEYDRLTALPPLSNTQLLQIAGAIGKGYETDPTKPEGVWVPDFVEMVKRGFGEATSPPGS